MYVIIGTGLYIGLYMFICMYIYFCIYMYIYLYICLYVKVPVSVTFFPLVCLHQVVCVPYSFPGSAVLLCCSGLRGTRWVFWGCMLYLAGLDASSTRSPSVLILLVLADLDGSCQLGDNLSIKISFDGLPKTLFNA